MHATQYPADDADAFDAFMAEGAYPAEGSTLHTVTDDATGHVVVETEDRTFAEECAEDYERRHGTVCVIRTERVEYR